MTDSFRVMVQEVGGLTMLDATSIYSDAESDAKENARDRAADSGLHFKFQKDTPDLPNIQVPAEIWWGWWNDDTGAWLPGRVNGGFNLVQENTMSGDTKHIHCTVSGYSCMLGRRCFRGWPTGNDSTGIPTNGIGAGFSVTDWLSSNGGLTGGASGIVRAMLPNLDYSGVDSSFDSRIFTAQTIPGNSDPDFPYPGQWCFSTVSTVLHDIADAVRKVWPAVRPVYWIEAAANGPVIQPRFVFRDDADSTSGAVVGRFSTNPATGEYYFG